jgi:hypothetical protein
VASASGSADPTACTQRKPYRVRAARQPPASGSTRSGVTPTACAAIRGRSPNAGTAVEQRFLGRQIQLVDQPVRAVGLQSIRNSLSNELTIARAKICASKKSQTQITALGNLPNAVIGEP